MSIKEETDFALMKGEVAWRCHKCNTKVDSREQLHQRGNMLLCRECIEPVGK